MQITSPIKEEHSNEKCISLIIENVPAATWVYDTKDQTFLFVSPSMQKLIGYSDQELLAQPGRFFNPLADEVSKDEGIDLFEAMKTDQQSLRHWVTDGKGNRRKLRSQTRPVASDSGPDPLVVGMTSDVTAQHNMQQLLKKWIERFDIAANAAGIGVWDYTYADDHLFWDSRMFDIFGVSRDTFSNRYNDWRERIHPDDLERVETAIAESSKTKNRLKTEFRIVRPDGEIRRIKAYMEFGSDELTGALVRLSGVNIDVTTRRIIDERLTQIQKLDAVGQLSGGIAHDFNNLLTVIKGNLQLTLSQLPETEDPVNTKLRKWISSAITATEKGTDLSKRLLGFARQQVLAPEVVDVQRIILDMRELLTRTLEDHIEIEIVAKDHELLALTDVGQLENAIINLALNARDAMPEGGKIIIEAARVTFDCKYALSHPDTVSGRHVMVAVTDTGCGMSKDTQEKIFEPFFTTKTETGTGLGLSMVYGFVKQSGGHVSVYSEEGIGTTFRIYLPLYAGALEKKEDDQAPGQRVSARPGKILLVDDNREVGQTACDILRNAGHEVIFTDSGKDALRLLALHQDIDLLLTDVVMPEMNGLELVDVCRTLRPDLPVILGSGYADQALRRMNLTHRDGDWIAKPYDVKRLIFHVDRALQKGLKS